MTPTWTAPRLIVLARARPEESVLAGCKTITVWTGPGGQNLACIAAFCNNCQRIGTS
jgi:hypothetical protein